MLYPEFRPISIPIAIVGMSHYGHGYDQKWVYLNRWGGCLDVLVRVALLSLEGEVGYVDCGAHTMTIRRL